MKAPKGKLAAFVYSMAVGVGIMCIVITIVVLLMQLIVSPASAASTFEDPETPYVRGIPQRFERYPYLERSIRQLSRDVRMLQERKCSACILREYYNTTPTDRLQRLRDTINTYDYE